jgi:uncharacterized phage infection (PIP) family protein YhgE
LLARYDDIKGKLFLAFIILTVNGGLPEYQDGVKLESDELTQGNVNELVRLTKLRIPELKNEEETVQNNIKKLNAAKEITENTVKSAYSAFSRECMNIPQQYRETAHTALSRAEFLIMPIYGVSSSGYREYMNKGGKSKIDALLKRHGIQPKPKPLQPSKQEYMPPVQSRGGRRR